MASETSEVIIECLALFLKEFVDVILYLIGK